METRTRYRGSPHRLHRAHPGNHAAPAGPRRRGRRQHRHPRDGMASPGDRTRPVPLRPRTRRTPAAGTDRQLVLGAKEENGGDEAALRALARKLGAAPHRWQDTVLDSLLDRESWNVTDEAFKAILTTKDAVGGGPARIHASEKLAAYA